MRIALAAAGFTSTIAQVLLMRELVATFYGNELLFGLALAAWLAWVAAGAGTASRWVPRTPRFSGGAGETRGRVTFAAGLALAAALLPAQIALVRGARTLLGVTPGAFVEFGPMVGGVILVLAPLCLLSGFLFTLGASLTVMPGQSGTAGRAYVWESAGAVFGGALFSFAFVRWLDPFQAALLVGAVNAGLALRLWMHDSQKPGLWQRHSDGAPSHGKTWFLPWTHDRGLLKPETWNLKLPLAVFLVLALAALPVGRSLHRATLRWQWSAGLRQSAALKQPALAFAGDSPYGRIVVQARDGQRVFFQNGLLAFETQGTFPEEVAHFPLLMHPEPREVLLIGGGVAGGVREILKHPVAGVTYVELDPLLIEAAQAHLAPEDAAVLDDPRVTLALTDGRLYVADTHQTFDVVILDLPEPSTGALNRFYTREFFAAVRAVLAPGGVFALGLPSAENYWSAELARRNGSVYHTLRVEFPEVVVLPGEHNFFLASAGDLETTPTALVARMAGRGVETRWVTTGYVEYVFTTDRFAGVQAELAATEGVRLNRDLAPICYYYDLALWLSRFYPNLRGVFERAGLVNLWWVAVPLALAVGLLRWRRRWAVPFAIATIGLAEMALEVVILFAFQVLHGTVYAQVSLIVTAFMAGLALGGAASNRMLVGTPITSSASQGQREARRSLIAVQAATAAYSGLFPLILSLPVPAPAFVFPLLALAAGALTGMAFPLAATLMPGDAGRAAGLLYGADLVGGCLGALLSAAFLVPVLGIPQTCVAVALVGLAGLAALV